MEDREKLGQLVTDFHLGGKHVLSFVELLFTYKL